MSDNQATDRNLIERIKSALACSNRVDVKVPLNGRPASGWVIRVSDITVSEVRIKNITLLKYYEVNYPKVPVPANDPVLDIKVEGVEPLLSYPLSAIISVEPTSDIGSPTDDASGFLATL